MSYPTSPYITERNGGLYVAGSRVSLDSVVVEHQKGATPEGIVVAFPTLELWQVYGALAYYLEHEAIIREYVAEGERQFEAAPRLSETNPELFARLEDARRQMRLKRA